MKEALEMALTALEANQYLVADHRRHVYVMEYNSIIEKCKEALAQPEPPPECKTEAEQTAFAFGWNKALEQQRLGQTAYRAVKTYHEGKPVYVAQKRPPNCGTSFCSCIECIMETEQK